MRFFLTIAIILFFLGAAHCAFGGEKPPPWLERANAEAAAEGYGILSFEQLYQLYENGDDLLVIDSRAGYEYRMGHLPDAVNFEFDLADRSRLTDEKRKEYIKLLGGDLNRRIVAYCRNYS